MKASALAAIGVVSTAAACLYDRDPTGLSDARRSNTSSQGGLVYAEERRAIELARVIPDLAGFLFDTSGNVVVLLKGGGESPATKSLLQPRFGRELARGRVRNPAADLIVRTAKYSFLELKEWRDRLMNADILTIEGVVWLDLDEAQNRVVIGLDVDADRAALGDIARDIGVPAEALAFEVTGPYQPQETLRDEFRPIKGGIQIQRVSGTSAVTCTLGFTAVWQDQDVFLTAGHCSPDPTGIDGVEQFQPTAPLSAGDSASITALGREIAHVSEPCGNRRCSYSDAAIYELIADTVPPIPSQSWTLGHVAHPAGGCFPGPCDPVVLELGSDWVIDTTHDSFVVNDLVSKIGSATGWSSGNVTKTCVNVSPAQGVTLYCQMYAGYGQDEGDSGAPILLDIMGGADSTVTLGGIHSGKAGKNAVFSPWSGIVQDYGDLSVVFVQEDTTRPPVPAELNLPSDSTYTVEAPGYPRSELLYFRNVVGIIFDDTTGGLTIRRTLSRYGGTIIGGVPSEGEYIVQIPDPGPTFAALDSVVTQLNTEPGVKLASHVTYRWPFQVRSRYPNDGPGARRTDWATPSNATRSLLHIRAPLAWGCETGTYTSGRVRVGVIDAVFDTLHPDLTGGLQAPPASAVSGSPNAALQSNLVLRSHGTSVAGVLAARADNDTAIAGVLWGADLRMYSFSRNQAFPLDYRRELARMIDSAISRGDRVIVLSLAFGPVADSTHVARIRLSLERYLRAGGLLALATGQNQTGQPGLRLTIAQVAQTTDTLLRASDRAAAQLYDAGYSTQIFWVAGTDNAGVFWPPSNFWAGATVVAPATDIVLLANTADGSITRTSSGTSYSAPYVAGVAGLLWALDPTLTASDAKDLIVRGAQLPRWNPQTGQMDSSSVSGAPETVYQLDAYSALKLAAERQGAPLCGNRVWVANQQVVAERDAVLHTSEPLVNLGESGGGVHVRHGGRRIEVPGQLADRAFELQQGQWIETQDTATTPAGGTFYSMWARSHDLDSTANLRFWTMSGSAAFEVNVYEIATQTQTSIDTLVVPTTQFSGFVCIQLDDQGACSMQRPGGAEERVVAELIFPSVGGRLLLAVTYFVTRDVGLGGWHSCAFPDTSGTAVSCRSISYEDRTERADVWSVDLASGQDTLLWTFPDRVFWFGASEDGAQLVIGEGVGTVAWTWQDDADGWQQVWSDPGSVSGCAVRYRSMTDGTDVAPAIATPDACIPFDRGQGTVAPAPPVSLIGR